MEDYRKYTYIIGTRAVGNNIKPFYRSSYSRVAATAYCVEYRAVGETVYGVVAVSVVNHG